MEECFIKKHNKVKMKKQEKAKPRSSRLEEASFKKKVFKNYAIEMEEKTEEYNKSHNSNVNFYLAQHIANRSDLINKVLELSYFYDKNFVGNKDFMHIPSFSQVASNLIHYPILVASKNELDGSSDLLGVTTIKFENNESYSDNPYFPSKGENVLSITGVLTRNNEASNLPRIRGIGKELYKSAIRSAIKLNQEKRIRLICEIDCRNEKSLSAITKAVKDLQNEGHDICSFITGYYEIYNKQKQLIEAPTFILEVNLNCNKYENTYAEFSFLNCKKQRLNYDLLKEIKEEVNIERRYLNVDGQNHVLYNKVEPINIQNVVIVAGNSADGNERVPRLNPVLEYVMSKKSKDDTINFAIAE
jgi:hypothetical protein